MIKTVFVCTNNDGDVMGVVGPYVSSRTPQAKADRDRLLAHYNVEACLLNRAEHLLAQVRDNDQ